MNDSWFLSLGTKAETSTWDVIASAGTLLSALATLLLVLLALRQLRALRSQVEQSAEQTKLSSDAVVAAATSARAAEDSVREAARTRADTIAPSIVVVFEPPQPTPRVSLHVGPQSAAHHQSELSQAFTPTTNWQGAALEVGEPFVLPDFADHTLWFLLHGTIINEGQGSARVALGASARFEVARRLGSQNDVPLPAPLGPTDSRQYLIRPGEQAAFVWVVANSVRDWVDACDHPHPPNPHGADFLTVTSMTATTDVVDHVYVVAAARPVQRLDEARLMIKTTESAELGVVVYPTQRTYMQEGTGFKPEPWGEPYEEWRKQHEGH